MGSNTMAWEVGWPASATSTSISTNPSPAATAKEVLPPGPLRHLRTQRQVHHGAPAPASDGGVGGNRDGEFLLFCRFLLLPPQEEQDATNPLETTVVQTQYESLLSLVEELKQKLIAERKKNATLEKDLR